MEEEAKEMKSHVRRRLGAAKDLRAATDMGDVRTSVGRLKGGGKLGRKLTKAGMALIAIPDPVTDVPGAVMVASGLAISRLKDSASLSDIQQEVKRIADALRLDRQGF
ncbi:MAG: hypothetical protein JRN39_07375 [Nitrososphaerota archaeon]|nr:hypothetical protein [Nitrososphaerota archaeon]